MCGRFSNILTFRFCLLLLALPQTLYKSYTTTDLFVTLSTPSLQQKRRPTLLWPTLQSSRARITTSTTPPTSYRTIYPTSTNTSFNMALVFRFVTFMNTVHFLSKLPLIFVASALTYVLPLLRCGLYISGCEWKELQPVMAKRHLLGRTEERPD